MREAMINDGGSLRSVSSGPVQHECDRSLLVEGRVDEEALPVGRNIVDGVMPAFAVNSNSVLGTAASRAVPFS